MSVTPEALWFIESHLSDELSLETIADAVGVSRFHLSRAFPVSTGNAVVAYVRERRLSEAAKALAKGAPDILELALNTGYGSHEAFTRAFRQLFGVTPEQLRAQATIDHLKLKEPLRMNQATATPIAPPRVVAGNELLIFGSSERYNNKNIAAIPAQWNRFGPYLGTIRGQVGFVSYGVVCNADEAGNFDYICGVEVKQFPADPVEFARLRIAPQTYAVFEHREHISSIKSTWNRVWNEGLRTAGYRALDAPSFERYDEKFDGRTGLGGLELWVPVQGLSAS